MQTPAAGWFADPEDATQERWWDGAVWGDQRRSRAATPPPPPPAVPSAEQPAPQGSKRLEHALVPTDRSGLAIAAGYLGLFALIVFPAPLALIVGVLALRDLKKHPEKLGRGRAWFGTIVGGLVTVVFGLAFVFG